MYHEFIEKSWAITISLFKTKIEKQVRDPNLESLPPHQEKHLKLSTDKDTTTPTILQKNKTQFTRRIKMLNIN
jgi:hypothetical protein